jgi:hypothetical protein
MNGLTNQLWPALCNRYEPPRTFGLGLEKAHLKVCMFFLRAVSWVFSSMRCLEGEGVMTVWDALCSAIPYYTRAYPQKLLTLMHQWIDIPFDSGSVAVIFFELWLVW